MSISKRQSNVELLRIVSMLMIISLHFLGHGGVINALTEPTANFFVASFIRGICFVAVNCFILISGYFGVDSKFKPEKVLRLALQVWIYSVIIFGILLISGKVAFTAKNAVYAIFPLCTNMDEFSTEYVMMYVLSPFINLLVSKMSKGQFKWLIIILAVLFVVIPNVFFVILGEATIEFGGGYGVVWFIILYFTGAYLKKNDFNKKGIKKSVGWYIVLGLLVPVSCFAAVIMYKLTGATAFWNNRYLFYSYTSILVFPASVALFVLFINIPCKFEKSCKAINFAASTTFGIYLIHDNRFLRPVLWDFINPAAYSGLTLWLIFLASVAGIFVAGMLIDKLRQLLFEMLFKTSPYRKLADKLNGLTDMYN